MGLYDTVHAVGAEFRCSEGHDLSGEEFQTKDLDCSMGYWTIENGRLTGKSGGYGDPQLPFLGRICIYADCTQCPAFVQAGTANLCACWVEFEVEIVDDVVRKVTRTSPSTAEWLKSEPAAEWMRGCLGPMPHVEAQQLHIDGLVKRFEPK